MVGVVAEVSGADVVTSVRLQDVPNHVREVALHGVRHGAVMALASAQVHSSHELWFLPYDFLATTHPGDHECLIEDFFSAANSVAFISHADDIIAKVFSGP